MLAARRDVDMGMMGPPPRRPRPTRTGATPSSGSRQARTASSSRRPGYASTGRIANRDHSDLGWAIGQRRRSCGCRRARSSPARCSMPPVNRCPTCASTAMRRFSNPACRCGWSRPGADKDNRPTISASSASQVFPPASSSWPRCRVTCRCSARPGVEMTAARAQPARQVRTTTATTFYPGTTDQVAALPIAVAAGAEVGNINFAMQTLPSFRVSGIVVDQDGKPVGGAMVMLMGESPQRYVRRSGRKHAHSGQRTIRHRRCRRRQLSSERIESP